MLSHPAVLFANEVFYHAFRTRDLKAMDGIWAREAPVAVVHPGWTVLSGRGPVMESWRGILSSARSPDIAFRNPEAFIYGNTALVVCYEEISASFLVATNVFVLERGHCKMVHHQAGPCNAPPPEEIADEQNTRQ
jgi:hypothetical protein